MPVAEGDGLVAFQLLVPTEADVVATLFGSRRLAVTVDDGEIKKIVLVKLQDGSCKDGINAAVGLPPPEGTINACVVDFRTALVISFDRQFLPLTADIEQPQNVVEDLEQTQLWCRTAAAAGKMRQDKLLKRSETQLRGNRLPALASSHSDPPESWTLPGSAAPAENLGHSRLADGSACLKNPQPVVCQDKTTCSLA